MPIEDISNCCNKYVNIEHIKSKKQLLDKLNADGERLLQNFEGFTNNGTNFLSSNTSLTLISCICLNVPSCK